MRLLSRKVKIEVEVVTYKGSKTKRVTAVRDAKTNIYSVALDPYRTVRVKVST